MLSIEATKTCKTREAILDAAFDCLQLAGYKKMSMEDVAHAVGISRAAIYLHFENKQELTLAVMEQSARRIQDEMRTIARGKGPVVKRLEAMMRHRVMARVDKCNRATCSLDELLSAIREPFLHLRERMSQIEGEIIAETLIEGRLSGEFEFEDAFRTAETLVLTTSGLMPFSLSARELGDRRQVEEKLDRLIHLGVRSVRPPGKEALYSTPTSRARPKLTSSS